MVELNLFKLSFEKEALLLKSVNQDLRTPVTQPEVIGILRKWNTKVHGNQQHSHINASSEPLFEQLVYRTVGERAGEGQTSAVLHEQRHLVLTNISFLHALTHSWRRALLVLYHAWMISAARGLKTTFL
ncbi:unnamed protein product [Caretta caretta]